MFEVYIHEIWNENSSYKSKKGNKEIHHITILKWMPLPPPRDRPWDQRSKIEDRGVEPPSLMPPALAGRFFTTSTTWEEPSKAPQITPTSLSSLHHLSVSQGIHQSTGGTQWGVLAKPWGRERPPLDSGMGHEVLHSCLFLHLGVTTGHQVQRARPWENPALCAAFSVQIYPEYCMDICVLKN